MPLQLHHIPLDQLSPLGFLRASRAIALMIHDAGLPLVSTMVFTIGDDPAAILIEPTQEGMSVFAGTMMSQGFEPFENKVPHPIDVDEATAVDTLAVELSEKVVYAVIGQ